jgi:general L-amino acid transport system permease protein
LSLFDLIYLNIEGLFIPAPVFGQGATLIGGSILVSIVIAGFTLRVARQRRESTGRRFQHARYGYAAAVLLPIATLAALDFPVSWDVPVFKRFNFEGGFALQPEFVAMLLAITLYNAAFIGEIIRAGIMSVHKGQREAARAIGMSYWQTLRFIILPQAIRRVLPPLGNNFISMIKDSSLVSVMGVADITFKGKVYAASTFRFFQTYNVVAYLYLIMTITLTLGLRALEKRWQVDEE